MKKWMNKGVAGIAVTLALVGSSAFGAAGTWVGGGTNNSWLTAGNWNGDTIAGATGSTAFNGDTATFNSSSGTVDVTNVNIKNISLDTNAGAFVFSTGSSPFFLTNGGNVTIQNTFSGSNITEAISGNIIIIGTGQYTFQAPLTGTNHNILNIAGSLTATGSTTVSLRGNNAETSWNVFSADITAPTAANSPIGLSIASGLWKVSGNNSTMNGTVSISANATLGIGSATALGTGTLNLGNGAIFDNVSGGALTLAGNNPIAVVGAFTYLGSNSLNTGTGAIVMGSANFPITVTSNTLTLGGNVSGGATNRTFTKSGAGTLIMSGSSISFSSSSITVSAGTLLITGSSSGLSAFTVSSGATLGGANGVIGTNNAGVTLNAGSFLNISGGTGQHGILTMNLGTGVLNLSSALTNAQSLVFTLGGGNSDEIILGSGTKLTIGTGLLDLADFNFSILGAGNYDLFATSDGSSLLTSGNTLGTNLTDTIDGYLVTLGLSGDGSALVLSVSGVPEPSTWTLMGVGVALLVWVGYRKRKASV